MECWNRLLKSAVAEPAKAEQAKAAKKTETSLADVKGLSSSVKDFVPLLQMSGVLGAMQTDDKTGVMTVALNLPFPGGSSATTTTGVKRDNALQIKAMIDTTAELFEPVKKKLPEANRDALVKELLDAKEDAENVSLNATYNVSSRRLGRNFYQHADALDALFRQALALVAPSRAAVSEAAAALGDAVPEGLSLNNTPWSAYPASDQASIAVILGDLVEARKQFDKDLDAAIKKSGLDVYGQLVNNQPQLQVSVTQTARDDLFGPNLLTGRVSFEMGLGNSLNAALGPHNGTCAEKAADCYTHYSTFLADASRRAAIKAGSRLSFFVEFVQNEAYHFFSEKHALDLVIAEGTGWTAGLDYGRLIAVEEDGTAGGRVDGSFKWEAPADTSVDRRFVASVTLTKKIGEVSVPFGIVYANKPKFLTGVDHGLSAHLGLKFNLFNINPSSGRR
jgi:hypothetical protein